MSRFIFSLSVLLGIASLGCVDANRVASPSEQRDLFDLPTGPTPAVKEVFARPANGYRRYHQKNYEFVLTSDQPGYTGRQFKTLIPDVSSGTQVPCLFYNPAGATAFNGKSAGTAEIDPMLPYVKAGFAVVIYGTDGGTVEITERTSIRSLAKQAEQYANAHAGLINARHAVDFVLQEFSQIDAQRLYTIGHSSGGKQALLVAAADSRIAGCVAWAPACQVSKDEQELLQKLGRARRSLSVSMLDQSDPMRFAARIKVPLLLVHSASDEIVSSADVLGFGERVPGADVLAVPSQNHFDIPDVAQTLTQKWLARLATAEGQTLAAANPASTANDVRPVSNRKSNRRTTTRGRHSSRQGKSDTPSIQSNPFAN
ncbi:alpha/beta hydrolase family protein [Roseimaritima ulvae]|uniref:Alpha/beta hydrolase family protein n=1 Tax=Roseimaritima ulvae TaxID=980254 RepID=A0A5B9QS12_9BACT|nr:prolyl oligopeptidase family serine peptidase [Roseimaritima ulvae]QEG41887.1 Alpha/beta hydrolase family protein [Roseimaritima ulvae]